MTDIAFALLPPDGDTADLVMSNGDLALDDTLLTAIIHSLLADRVADAADGLPAGADMRGWWGDAYLPPLADGSADHWGSKLWLDRRLTATTANGNRICTHISQALAWMIADGVATDITVTGTFLDAESFAPNIAISQTGVGGKTVQKQFSLIWNRTLGTIVAA